ncbi:hypothetical protein TcWFU_004414 [Taenia crassiceps]|uniref:Uncharacterized protein n=1 Tax=Taenia crassiceps TaxID=6207 RepID=A0ABR4Q9M8_9CEST
MEGTIGVKRCPISYPKVVSKSTCGHDFGDDEDSPVRGLTSERRDDVKECTQSRGTQPLNRIILHARPLSRRLMLHMWCHSL